MSNANDELKVSFDLEDVQDLNDLSYEDTDLDEMDEMEDIRVTLEMEDGTVTECSILTIYEIEGQDYIALLPLEDDDETATGDVLVMRYFENDEEEEPTLEDITDDEELSLAINVLAELMKENDIDLTIEE